MTPELRERLARAAYPEAWNEENRTPTERSLMPIWQESALEKIDAAFAELTAAGYAVVDTQTIAVWASRYDEVLRFSKWYSPRPGSVFNDPRAEMYRNTLGEMRNAAAMLKAAEDQT